MSAEPEKRLGQVAWEALGHVERWRTVPLLMGGQQYAVMAAAVEAEVLRRVGNLLEHCRRTCAATHAPGWLDGYSAGLRDATWCLAEAKEGEQS